MREYGVERVWRDMRLNRIGAGHRRDHARRDRPLLRPVRPGLAALLEQLHRDGVEHDSSKEDRLERLRNLEPDSAALLALLVRAIRARAMLELGTSNGYSTLWLADARAASVGGS